MEGCFHFAIYQSQTVSRQERSGVPKALVGLKQGVCFHIYTAGILYTSIVEKQTVARLLATSGLLWLLPDLRRECSKCEASVFGHS